jgi:hypothetical protein
LLVSRVSSAKVEALRQELSLARGADVELYAETHRRDA